MQLLYQATDRGQVVDFIDPTGIDYAKMSRSTVLKKYIVKDSAYLHVAKSNAPRTMLDHIWPYPTIPYPTWPYYTIPYPT